MQIATFVVAVLGILLAALSLGWQGASYVLAGRRVKMELLRGAIDPQNGDMVTGPVNGDSNFADNAAEEGFSERITAIRVRNVGRIPVTVTSWALTCSPKGLTYSPIGATIGKASPHRLDAGDAEVWAVRSEVIHRLVITSSETFNVPASQVTVRGMVELGDGRTPMTPERLSGDGI